MTTSRLNVIFSSSSLYLCGLEQLEIFKRFPDVAREADLDPVDSPR